MLGDIFKDIAPLLGVLLPAIAAYFAYRASERKRDKDIAEAAKPNLHVIGGGIASEQGVKLYVEEMQKMTQAINRLAEGQHRQADAIQESHDRWKRFLNEVEEIRRSMEEIASRLGRARR